MPHSIPTMMTIVVRAMYRLLAMLRRSDPDPIEAAWAEAQRSVRLPEPDILAAEIAPVTQRILAALDRADARRWRRPPCRRVPGRAAARAPRRARTAAPSVTRATAPPAGSDDGPAPDERERVLHAGWAR